MKQQIFFLVTVYVSAQSIAAWPSFAQVQDHTTDDCSDPLYDEDIFEGDILITEEDFEEYYGGPQTKEPGMVRFLIIVN